MDGDSADHRPGERGRGKAQPGNQEQPTTNDLKRAGQIAEPIAEPDLRKQPHPERIRGELRSADPDEHATRGNAQHQAEDIERRHPLGRRNSGPSTIVMRRSCCSAASNRLCRRFRAGPTTRIMPGPMGRRHRNRREHDDEAERHQHVAQRRCVRIQSARFDSMRRVRMPIARLGRVRGRRLPMLIIAGPASRTRTARPTGDP